MSLKHEQAQVRHFMHRAGQATPAIPTLPPMDEAVLRYKLIYEELQEFSLALNRINMAGVVYSELDLLTDMADALADLLYVVLGSGVALGIDLDDVFQEVHRSNMTKFIDGHRRADGKYVKGPSYTPANIRSVLSQQCAQTSQPDHAHITHALETRMD